MAKKFKKEEVIDEETSGPPINPTLAKIQQINSPVKKELVVEEIVPVKESLNRQSINLVVNPKLIFQFEEILNKFKGATEAYFTYPSKVQLFETGCSFLEDNFKSRSIYSKAPANFVKFISRKGKRPQSDERDMRKGSGKAMFLNLTANTIDIYYNLIFSFLKEKNDVGNEYYSASYFFYDFVTLLDSHFDSLCQYENDNPRE